MIGAFVLVLALGGAGPGADGAQAAPAPVSLQQQFDAATEAFGKGECEKAVGLFEALERGGEVKHGSLPEAAIAVRKGECLLMLRRRDEGKAAILKGLPVIERAGASFAADVHDAQMALGKAAYADYDFDTARKRFEAALAQTTGLERLSALAMLSKVTAFDGTTASLDYASEGLRIIDAEPGPSKDFRAAFLTIHARALLNQGKAAQAYGELKEALKLTGGLTDKVSISQATMRADLAQAALLAGQRDDAHRYLAYTGAGRIAESPFAMAKIMDVPVCGSETGLQPQDSAVVEFSIDSDGSVLAAQTVYTRGGPDVAAAFAKAVREWYWDSEQLAKIPPFYLASTRVELRCTRAGADAPDTFSPLVERFNNWAASEIAIPESRGPDMAAARKLREALAAPGAKDDGARYVAMAGVLYQADPLVDADKAAMLADALSAARKASLPTEVINALQVFRAVTDSPWSKDKVSPKRDMPIYVQSLLALAASPEISQDAMAAATLRLAAASQGRWLDSPARAAEQLELVAADTRLGEHHPLRQAADLRLANLAADAGRMDDARKYFERTGLSEEQCALLGVKPDLTKPHVSSSDYPTEALMYGFEGWAKVEYDVKTDGRTVGGRTLMAYPPFVFSDGAAAMTKGFVFEKSYRPGDTVACTADRQSLRFQIPR